VRRVVPGAGLAAGEKHVLAAWHIEAQQQRSSWAVRALAGLAAASLHEDSLGTLLQDEPGLGDVLVALLDLLLVLQQYARASVGAAAWLLHCRAPWSKQRTCLWQRHGFGRLPKSRPLCPLQSAFGRRQSGLSSNISRVLCWAGGGRQPAAGRRVDAAALALADNCSVALFQLVATFDGLQGVLDKASRQPCYARPAELRAALEGFIAEKQ
jgi:hypothetical protein